MRRARTRTEQADGPDRHTDAGDELGAEVAALRARVDLEDRLRRALRTADDENEVLTIVERALVERFGDSTRLLVPDQTHLRLGPTNLIDPHVAIVDADGCVGFRTEESVLTPSSDRFDACAHLRGLDPPCSGVCVPVSAGGSLVGVVHWTGVEHHPLAPAEIATIEAVAHLAACHVLIHRAAAAETPRTDPLTGLLNPHSLNRAVLGLVTDLVPFSLAVCSIDDFEGYNAHHGHGSGDEALRLFTRCLRATVRPDDIVGRTDLDQFTVVFPSTSAIDAAHALERVRERLALALTDSGLAHFTASVGVADSNQGSSIEAIVETAGLACLLARSAGANRVVVAGEETTDGVHTDDGQADADDAGG